MHSSQVYEGAIIGAGSLPHRHYRVGSEDAKQPPVLARSKPKQDCI